MDGSSTSEGVDGPASTVALFGTILKKAEADAAGDSSTHSRARLFVIATKLVKLNLRDESAHTPDSLAKLWDIVFDFLNRYPDYALYRPSPDVKQQQQQQQPEQVQQQNRNDENDAQEETMANWLLPRLLRRLAVMVAGDLSKNTGTWAATEQPRVAAEGSSLSATAAVTLAEKAEAWIATCISNCSAIFYHRQEAGLSMKRELVGALCSLQTNISDLASSANGATFPTSLVLLPTALGTATIGPPISGQNRDKRPFYIHIDDALQAQALHLSISRVLATTLTRSSLWVHEQLLTFVHGFASDPHAWRPFRSRKGKEHPLLCHNILAQRLKIASTILSASVSLGLPKDMFHSIGERLVEVLVSRVEDADSAEEVLEHGSPVHACLQECIETLYTLHTSTKEHHRGILAVSKTQYRIMAHSLLQITHREQNAMASKPWQSSCILVLASNCKLAAATLAHQPTGDASHTDGIDSGTIQQLVQAIQSYVGEAADPGGDRSRRIVSDALGRTLSELSDNSENSRKRKEAPETDGRETVRMKNSDNALLPLVDGFDATFMNTAKTSGWQTAFQQLWSSCIAVSPAELTALARIVCTTSQANGSDNRQSNGCRICRGEIVMDELEPKTPVEVRSPLPAMLETAYQKLSPKDNDCRTAFWQAFAGMISHESVQGPMLQAWLNRLLRDLDNRSRKLRLAAGRAANAILAELYRINPSSPSSTPAFFLKLEHMLKSAAPPVRLTTATTVTHLIRIASGSTLNKAMPLVVHALASNGTLRAVVATQLDSVCKARNVAPYKFFFPHQHILSPIVARSMDATFSLLYTFTDILRTSVRAFLQSPGITRLFITEAVMNKREDIIHLLAECSEVSAAELLVVNVDCCFAPLYFHTISKFEDCQRFCMALLATQKLNTTYQRLLQSNLPAVLLEILVRASVDNPLEDAASQLDSIVHRVFREVRGPQVQTSLNDANLLLCKAGTVLAIFGRAGDSLRGMYGKKSREERCRLLQGMEILVGRIGSHVHSAAPQLMTILQTSFRDRDIRLETLHLWRKFVRTLAIADIKPLLAQTTAIFVQAWPDCAPGEKAVIQSILSFFLVERQHQLDAALISIADMSSIPELRDLQTRLAARRTAKTLEDQLKAFLDRLDTVNEATLVQALRELLAFLQDESSTIYRLATGTAFPSILGQTTHELLKATIRSSDARSPARSIALQCLGVLGALDPDRMAFPAEESAFVIEHDLRERDECMNFAVYTIEKVLVRVLRTTNDPQQQSALYLAIQGLAAVCGFDDKVRRDNAFQPGVDAALRSRWNGLPRSVQEVAEPLISTHIQVEHLSTPEVLSYPLYLHRPSYREWLQTWTSDLIAHLVNGNMGVLSSYSAAKLFGPLRAAVRRGHDLTVPHYLLPFLVFYVVTSGNVQQTEIISKEIQTVLQDQIAPSASIAMPPESRSLCAQAVFELMDHLNTWKRSRTIYVTRKLRKRANPGELEDALRMTRKIDALFKSLPQNSVADAAFKTKSHARALLNYERILYEVQPSRPAIELQTYYERLHNIYAELNEPDGMEGVSVSIISPTIQHQIREHEMTGRWTSAQSCWEVQLQITPDKADYHIGLLRCLRNLGHYDSLRTHIAGLKVKYPAWKALLAPYEIQSALISGDLAGLTAVMEHASPASAEVAFAEVILMAKGESTQSTDVNVFAKAAETLGSSITTASKDSYYRFYDAIVNLHMLHEVGMLVKQSKLAGANQRQQALYDQAKLASRLDLTAPAFSHQESILNMRRNTFRLIFDGNAYASGDIGPLWLTTSKIAIKAHHLQTAYSAILQANQYKADFAFIQSAKLYRANGQLHRALQEMEQGLKLLGVLDHGSSKKHSYSPDTLKKLAKATSRSARWMQETGRYEHNEITARFSRAIRLCPEWEAAYYRLGQYADDIIQASRPFERTASADPKQTDRNNHLVGNMEVCVHNFSKALRYGAKFIYQALPRMITIWLDFGAWPEIAALPVECLMGAGLGNSATSAVNPKLRKAEQYYNNLSPTMRTAVQNFEKIYAHIRRAIDRLPVYMWLSVLPQLASRINHESSAVYQQLAHIMERVIQIYPQQAIWTMIGILNSQAPRRRERCQHIVRRAQDNFASKNPGQGQFLIDTIGSLQKLVANFLEVANLKVEGYGSLSLTKHFPALKAMVPCDIIIPFQNAMTITLPTATANIHTHQPFPANLITFSGFREEIEIMQSVAKPRKIVITGSDGKDHRFLCKPLDDLRKDNRFMECTSLIGRLLMKDAQARKRSLHIRTYAVIPLHEGCGLIEWVPDTAGVRNLFMKCYEPRGITVWNEKIKKVYEGLKQAQKTDLAKCGEAFETQILPSIPPIFHEWFLSNFPEPTAWLKARTAYGRTAAVMAMVGFVMGLGDRHGENILIDTTNGDVVHVDFNCLFGMGFSYFDIVEKVPFRLTQNIVDGFGITGVEGVFRRCCEITLRILRDNRVSLISVLESFVHDPLLDLQLSRGVQRSKVGSARNESKEAKAKREDEARKAEARGALSTIGHKLRGTQSNTKGEPGDTVCSVEMTVETLFKEATDPKNLGGMYMGWAAWL